MTDIEPTEKLNWIDKLLLKGLIRKGNRILNKWKENKLKLEDDKRRKGLIRMIMSMNEEALTIEEKNPETGEMEEIDQEMLEGMTTIKLLEITEDCLKAMKKML